MPKVVPSCGMTRTHTYSYENMERNVRQKIKNRSLLNLSGFHYCNRVGNFSHLINIIGIIGILATPNLRLRSFSFTCLKQAVFLF